MQRSPTPTSPLPSVGPTLGIFNQKINHQVILRELPRRPAKATTGASGVSARSTRPLNAIFTESAVSVGTNANSLHLGTQRQHLTVKTFPSVVQPDDRPRATLHRQRGIDNSIPAPPLNTSPSCSYRPFSASPPSPRKGPCPCRPVVPSPQRDSSTSRSPTRPLPLHQAVTLPRPPRSPAQ